MLAAGDGAVRRGAYVSAERLLERALEIAPADGYRPRALLLAGRVDIAMRRYARAVARLEEAIAMTDPTVDQSLQADALGLKARVSWLQGRWTEALASAEMAVAALNGLPESKELARALSRLSQIYMLRARPEAEATVTRAIEVARRTGERAAEANARTNMLTVLSGRGVAPTAADLAETISLALEAGAQDEAARAVVNYLWAAALLGSVEEAETVVQNAVQDIGIAFTAEAYGPYLQLSLATLVYVPAGRWAEADSVLAVEKAGATVSASGRLVWLWLVTGLALRRGDLDLVDRHLPELEEMALASEEPQRILPMACVAMPRAILAGDASRVEELAEIVLSLHRAHAFVDSSFALTIPRSLAAIGDRDRLERIIHTFAGAGDGAPGVSSRIAAGLLARLDGSLDEASRFLSDGEVELARLGRHYDAACIALESAGAAEANGDAVTASAARQRASALLDSLGCVNPF